MERTIGVRTRIAGMPTTELFLAGMCLLTAANVALPLAFEFRQLLSIRGVVITELAFAFLLLAIVAKDWSLLLFGRHRFIGLLFYGLLTWIAVRTFAAILEGNDLGPVFRGVRHYLAFAVIPVCFGLFYRLRKERRRLWFTRLVRLSILAYCMYVCMLLLVVFFAPIREMLLISPFEYRIGSHTGSLGVPLILLAVALYRRRLMNARYIVSIVIAAGISLLLAQGRMSTAIYAGMLVLTILLYTVRRVRIGWLVAGSSLAGGLLVAGVAAFLALNWLIPDFDRFSELFIRRVQSQQADYNVLESVSRYSLGFGAFRERVWERIEDRPLVGYGEGASVGRTMSLEEGAYIDSTALTMWYKNGVVGVLLLYGVYFGLLCCLFAHWMRGGGALTLELSSVLLASLTGWLLMSVSSIALMYDWVMYPIFMIVVGGIACLEDSSTARVWNAKTE